MISRADFWCGILFIVMSNWFLGCALEKEFIKRMNRLTDFLDHRFRQRNGRIDDDDFF